MKKITTQYTIILAITFLNLFQPAFCQTGVRIASTAGTADPSAMLDIVASNKGLLVPRVNLVSLTNGTSPVASPATGLMVYNLGGGGVAAVGFYYWTGTAWVQLTAGGFSGAGTVNYVTKWTATNALGISQLFDNGTNVAIGHTSPSEKLDVAGNIKASGLVYWGNAGTRTETRHDAGTQGGNSGFFETSAPSPASSWYPGASSWQHLLEVRHSNTGNNYALQIAGSFFNQELWYRKTNNSGATGWTKVLSTTSNKIVTSFVNWGREDCPGTSTLVYAGFAASSNYGHSGSGANMLCLTNTPDWTGASYNAGNQNGALIYGVEFEFSGYGVANYGGTPAASFQNYDGRCAKCLVENASETMMLPGSVACPSGWTQQYWGYLVSTQYQQTKSEFVCLINNALRYGTTANSNGALWYPVEAELGSLTSPYVQDRELTCSVCTM